MRICGISDMHGQLSFSIEPCDLLLICGDILPLSIQMNSKYSKGWLNNDFKEWCNKQPCDKVFFIGGNHDMFIQNHEEQLRKMFPKGEKATYIKDETVAFNDIKIYGTPWSKTFGNWFFMKDEEELRRLFEEHEEEIKNSDIVISHDAPYGTSDVLLQEDCPWANGNHIGCKALDYIIEKTQPSILLHGHLHSTNHEMEKLGNTKVYNVSLLNENYKMVYQPLYLSI